MRERNLAWVDLIKKNQTYFFGKLIVQEKKDHMK